MNTKTKTWGSPRPAMITAAAALVLSAQPPAAQGGPLCLPKAQMEAILADKHHEAPVGAGIAGDGKILVQLWVSDAGTWSIVTTTPAKVSCMFAAGRPWIEAPKPLAGVPG